MAVLEASMSAKTRENAKKSAKSGENKTKKVLLVTQELKLARVLAGNNKTARDRALKSLKKWFQNRAHTMPFTEDDFLRLWKGLFYSMWMSDKPLIQEECAENIANLIHCLPLDSGLMFYKCGSTILINEWFGIDQLRLDKFLMFVRRLLRQALFVLKNEEWSRVCVKKFCEILSETIFNTSAHKPLSLVLHFIEIYMEEVAKVSEGALPAQVLTIFLTPAIKQLAFTDDRRIIDHIKKHIFIHLIRQSNLGLEYQEKYDAWKKLGFPGSIDSMKKIEENGEAEDEIAESDEETAKAFDPRAGRVDVELPQLKFHPKAISKALSEVRFDKRTNSKSRKCLNELSEHFKKISSGIYPLGVKKVKLATDDFDMSIKKAVNRLVKFDKKVMKKNKKRKLEVEEDYDKIELRGGKKVKFDKQLREKLQEEMEHIMKNPPANLMMSKKKRKFKEDLDQYIMESQDGFATKLPAKRKINDKSSKIPRKQKKLSVSGEVESVFERNSGTWLVTRIDLENVQTNSDTDSVKELFPKRQWEVVNEENHETKAVLEELMKVPAKKRHSLPAKSHLGAEKVPSPPKRVKINTRLNQSQDVSEHHRQILSSPAIPFDANKKPTKPLLKTPVKSSPVNPFYRGLNTTF